MLTIILLVISLSFTVYLVQILALRKKLKESHSSDFNPPVSIIKPLKGLMIIFLTILRVSVSRIIRFMRSYCLCRITTIQLTG